MLSGIFYFKWGICFIGKILMKCDGVEGLSILV